MKCYKCGNEISHDELECSNCGMSIEENKKADKLTGISAILLFVLPEIIGYMLYTLYGAESIISLIGYGLSIILGLSLLIYVRIKFPKNKDCKDLLCVAILLLTIGIGALLFFVEMCSNCTKVG